MGVECASRGELLQALASGVAPEVKEMTGLEIEKYHDFSHIHCTRRKLCLTLLQKLIRKFN